MIVIKITGAMGSGKSVMRKRIYKLIEEECGPGRVSMVVNGDGHNMEDSLHVEFRDGDFAKLVEKS